MQRTIVQQSLDGHSRRQGQQLREDPSAENRRMPPAQSATRQRCVRARVCEQLHQIPEQFPGDRGVIHRPDKAGTGRRRDPLEGELQGKALPPLRMGIDDYGGPASLERRHDPRGVRSEYHGGLHESRSLESRKDARDEGVLSQGQQGFGIAHPAGIPRRKYHRLDFR